MQLTISSIDYAPQELYAQVPIVVELVREIPGDDRPDYWLCTVQRPIRVRKGEVERSVTHLVLGARREGTRIARGVEQLPVSIGFVTDPTLLDDARVDFTKCDYVAIGAASETSGAMCEQQADA